jgi:hypothetical protein
VRPSYRTGSFEIFTYPHHSPAARVAGAVWRWRVEGLGVLMLTVAWVWIAYQIPESWPRWSVPVILVAVIVVIAVVPFSRRFVIRRVWCVFSRHRVRKCFVQSRVMTHEGLLPLFMWTRPTPVGDDCGCGFARACPGATSKVSPIASPSPAGPRRPGCG